MDGFRFDRATTLGREGTHFDAWGSFFDVLRQDPALVEIKLIAEPWDLGEGGYQLGHFPTGWYEWNGTYRDGLRDYWRGEAGKLGELASRFTGCSAPYNRDGRQPTASINFVTALDGFTLADLVRYNEKHNEAHGESNHAGESYNRAWNCRAEGACDDPGVRQLRARHQRNFLPTHGCRRVCRCFWAGMRSGERRNAIITLTVRTMS